MMNEAKKREYLERDIWADIEAAYLLNGIPFDDMKCGLKKSEKQKIQRAENALTEAAGMNILNRKKFAFVDSRFSYFGYSSKEVIEWAKGKKTMFPNFPYLEDVEPTKTQDTQVKPLDGKQGINPKSKTVALKIIGGLLMEGYRMDIHSSRLEGLREVLDDINKAGSEV